jgi:hypothetical protein
MIPPQTLAEPCHAGRFTRAVPVPVKLPFLSERSQSLIQSQGTTPTSRHVRSDLLSSIPQRCQRRQSPGAHGLRVHGWAEAVHLHSAGRLSCVCGDHELWIFKATRNVGGNPEESSAGHWVSGFRSSVFLLRSPMGSWPCCHSAIHQCKTDRFTVVLVAKLRDAHEKRMLRKLRIATTMAEMFPKRKAGVLGRGMQ